jgi:hypothetical protein
MKKLSFIAFLIAMLIIPSILLAGGNGAVKGDMIEWVLDSGGNEFPTDEVVGGVNLNIDANNRLIVTMHINRGDPNDVLCTRILVCGCDWEEVCSGEWMNKILYDQSFNLPSLNKNGCGSAQFKIPLDIPSDYELDGVYAYVSSSDNMGTWHLYGLGENGWIYVPLKK